MVHLFAMNEANGTGADVLAARPWEGITDAELAPCAGVPTMLSHAEEQLYLWLARDWATGAGEIVDLGVFAGGSTARLAEGLVRGGAAGSGRLVHAFDRFVADPRTRARVLAPLGRRIPETDDILPLVHDLLAPWGSRVTFHAGDIRDRQWDGTPVELLLIDAAKSAELADHIAATFFPALIPGRSIVVQQDFLHAPQPWLPVQMALFERFFRPFARVGPNAMAFLCIRAVTARGLRRARVAALTDRQMRLGLDAAAAAYAAFGAAPKIAAQKRRLGANPGARRAADLKAPPKVPAGRPPR